MTSVEVAIRLEVLPLGNTFSSVEEGFASVEALLADELATFFPFLVETVCQATCLFICLASLLIFSINVLVHCLERRSTTKLVYLGIYFTS